MIELKNSQQQTKNEYKKATPCEIENTIDLFFLHRLNSSGWLIYRIKKNNRQNVLFMFNRRLITSHSEKKIKLRPKKNTPQRLCLGVLFSSWKLWSQTIDIHRTISITGQIIAHQSVCQYLMKKKKEEDEKKHTIISTNSDFFLFFRRFY